MSLPHCKKPCADCPFRKDALKGWLGRNRMREISEATSFICHQTTNGSERDYLQCAGHMLLRKHENQFFRFAARIGVDLKLQGRELVFDTLDQAIDHHTLYGDKSE